MSRMQTAGSRPGTVSRALARDRLGVPAVLFFVLAGVAPLTVAAGVIPTAYATTERHHARRRRHRREDGADPTRPCRSEDDTGRLRLGSGVNRSGRSGRHWRALLRRKGQKGLRHEISAPLPRQSFRGLGRSGIPRP